VFLGIFFALPLYAALTICTMPCCKHDGANEAAVSAAPTPCATDCAVRADDATAAPAPTIAPEKRAPLVTNVAVGVEQSALVVTANHRPPHDRRRVVDTPLTVLHSVFRI
jgi:hypothetical protein